MSTIIDTIRVVADNVISLKLNLAKARQERKQLVSDYLSSIAQTLEDTSALLRQNVYPHGKCQELYAQSQHMEAAIGDLVGQQIAQELGAQLGVIHEIERLHAELGSLPDVEREHNLAELDQAAGQFRATAAFVRVSP